MPSPTQTRHALVIGAGLAGAAMCSALARLGWRLTLVDAAQGPAMGASGLPVGMLSPHVTRAPTPLSRLSALGVADMRAELLRLIPQGAGWQACEVDNLGHNTGRWPAALVRPAALVKAWLDEAAALSPLQTHFGARVRHLRRVSDSGTWQAIDDHGQCVAQAPVVVVAAAHGSLELLQQGTLLDQDALPLRPVQGQLSFGSLNGAPWMPRPQRDNGVFVPLYEDTGLAPQWPARIWAMGSTYERGRTHCHTTRDAHDRNRQSLQALCPAAADHMDHASENGQLLGWAQVRCASQDRLPLAGALPDAPALQEVLESAGSRRSRLGLNDLPRSPGLYMLSALGSRGLTLSHWCAKHLALAMSGQQLPLADADRDLWSALDPARFAWKRARRQPRPPDISPA